MQDEILHLTQDLIALADATQHITTSPAAYLAKNEASDAKHAAHQGIPAIVFGLRGAGNHGANE